MKTVMINTSKRLFISISMLFLCVAVMVSCAPTDGGVRQETATRTAFLMSTAVTFSVTGPDAEGTVDALIAKLQDFEQAASMFIENSEIGQLNQNAGQAVEIHDPDVWYVLSRAIECSAESEGLFDVTVGPVTRLWDILSDHPRVPKPAEIEAALALVDYHSLTVSHDEDTGIDTAMLEIPGQTVDLGGIAKGYALDICRRILDERGAVRALISIGGNVLAYKEKADRQPFIVGVRYPSKEDTGYFCALAVTDMVLSTSGAYERFFEQNGIIYHHIVDPRTGYPADSDIESVTVVLPDALLADYMSTRMFVGGLDYSLALMREQGIEAVVADKQGNVYVTESLRDNLVDELSDTTAYTFQFV